MGLIDIMLNAKEVNSNYFYNTIVANGKGVEFMLMFFIYCTLSFFTMIILYPCFVVAGKADEYIEYETMNETMKVG